LTFLTRAKSNKVLASLGAFVCEQFVHNPLLTLDSIKNEVHKDKLARLFGHVSVEFLLSHDLELFLHLGFVFFCEGRDLVHVFFVCPHEESIQATNVAQHTMDAQWLVPVSVGFAA